MTEQYLPEIHRISIYRLISPQETNNSRGRYPKTTLAVFPFSDQSRLFAPSSNCRLPPEHVVFIFFLAPEGRLEKVPLRLYTKLLIPFVNSCSPSVSFLAASVVDLDRIISLARSWRGCLGQRYLTKLMVCVSSIRTYINWIDTLRYGSGTPISWFRIPVQYFNVLVSSFFHLCSQDWCSQCTRFPHQLVRTCPPW